MPDNQSDRSRVDRRAFLGSLGVGAASLVGLAATATASTGSADPPPPGKSVGGLLDSPSARSARAFEIRMRAAELARGRSPVAQTSNGEEALYPNRIANFSKGLPHDAFGEVDRGAYDSFLGALRSGNAARFDALPMGGTRKLTNPLAGMAFDLEGPDAHHLAQPPAPTIASAQGGADLAELYWMALCRDVHFSEYSSSPVVSGAANDLSRLSDFRAPKVNGQVTPDTLFRGSTPGDLIGLGRINVANQRVAALRNNFQSLLGFSAEQVTGYRLISHLVHANVDHRSAFFYVLPANETGAANRNHQNICLPRNRRQISGARMAYRHCRIPPQEQLRHRTTHDLTATDHTRIYPCDGNLTMIQ